MKYNLISNGDHSNITAFIGGEMYVADSDHPNFKAIVAAALADDDSAVDLFDSAKAVASKFDKISERVSVAGGKIFFDGDEVDDSLTRQILRFMEEGEDDWKPLVNFFEKVASNPNEHSRVQLYSWIKDRNFTITDEGDILAYKGVRLNGEDTYLSVSSGTALVNGEKHTGQIPQKLGDLVEMPRSSVQHDPSVGCHTGLHVGTWDYARDFVGSAGAVVAVKVNPRDIVSVPTDCAAAKVRTCRYVLSHLVEGPIPGAVWREEADVCDDPECETCAAIAYCENCGSEKENDSEPWCDYCNENVCSECEHDISEQDGDFCQHCGTAL